MAFLSSSHQWPLLPVVTLSASLPYMQHSSFHVILLHPFSCGLLENICWTELKSLISRRLVKIVNKDRRMQTIEIKESGHLVRTSRLSDLWPIDGLCECSGKIITRSIWTKMLSLSGWTNWIGCTWHSTLWEVVLLPKSTQSLEFSANCTSGNLCWSF